MFYRATAFKIRSLRVSFPRNIFLDIIPNPCFNKFKEVNTLDTIDERIAQCIVSTGLTKTAFAAGSGTDR